MRRRAAFLSGISAAWIVAASVPAPANGADLGTVRQPDGSLAAPANTISLAASPSFYATRRGSHIAGNYSDTSIELGLSHRFDSSLDPHQGRRFRMMR